MEDYYLLTNTKLSRFRLYLFITIYKPLLEDPLPGDAQILILRFLGFVTMVKLINHSVFHLKKKVYVKWKYW